MVSLDEAKIMAHLNPKVGVVILNYKVKDKTLACIKSVQDSDYKHIDIIVVDNNSQDGLDEAIKTIKGVDYIQTGKNLGYTGGNNRGIKKALQKDIDYIFIINPDAKVDEWAISFLVDAMQDEEIGIAGPKILFEDKKTIWFAGGKLDLDNVLGSHRGVDEEDKGQYDVEEETQFVTGGAMMVRREVFEKVGLLDERYFLYYEDSDLCMRAQKAGYKIMYIPSAVVYHENAKSTGLGSPLQDYFITRNRLLFAHKFLSFRTRFALYREAIRNLKMPVRRQALWDYMTRNLGKGSLDKVLLYKSETNTN
jgi:GT2 family glycosyltransferase